MSKVLPALVGASMIGLAGVSNAAEPVTLTSAQMDEITAGLADLEPTAIIYSLPVEAGRRALFDSGVKNTGDTDSGVFNIKWFVDGREVGAYGSHAGVPAGKTVTGGNSQFSWTFGSAGVHTVTFAVDVDNQVKESQKINNSSTTNVGVNVRPLL